VITTGLTVTRTVFFETGVITPTGKILYGHYRETLAGLSPVPLEISGVFTLTCSTTRGLVPMADFYGFPVPSRRRPWGPGEFILPEIRHIFDLVGGPVDCVQFDKPHNYDRESREQMYAWMNRYLKNETDPAAAVEPDVVTEEPERLRALGVRPPELNGLEVATAYFRSRVVFSPPVLSGRRAWHISRPWWMRLTWMPRASARLHSPIIPPASHFPGIGPGSR
jgi:hypothetical protein